MSEENKALLRRWYEEGYNKHNVALVNELSHPDFVWHSPLGAEIKGIEATKQGVEAFLVAFPDGHVKVDDQVAEGDKVMTRSTWTGTHQGEFMGIAPTGKQVTMGLATIIHIADGKFVECWDVFDLFGILQQLGAAPQSTEANKALARRFFDDFLNKRDLALAEEIFADDFLFRAAHLPELRGPEGAKQFVTGIQASFPDYQYAIEELLVEGDKVVVRWTGSVTHKGEWMGIAPTGKSVTNSGIAILRISGGKIVEHWAEWDTLGFFQRLGVVPPLGKAEEKAAA